MTTALAHARVNNTNELTNVAPCDAWILTIFLGIANLLYVVSPPDTLLNWAIYAVPAISLILWLARSSVSYGEKAPISLPFLIGTALYLLAAVLSIRNGSGIGFRFIRETLIISGALLTFIPHFGVTGRHLMTLLCFLSVTVIAQALYEPSIFKESVSWAKSEGIAETSVAFSAAVLAIYFLITRQRPWFMLAIVVTVISFKRIVLPALALSFIYYMTVRSLIGLVGWQTARWILYTIVAVILVLCFFGGYYFNDVVRFYEEHTDMSVSPNAFSMGRFVISGYLSALLKTSDHIEWFFGHGAGSASRMAVGAYNYVPHNDWLKLVYDYGVIGTILICVAFSVIYMGSVGSSTILIFTSIIFVSDNTLIYFHYQFICFMIARALNEYEHSSRAVEISPARMRESVETAAKRCG